jgi:CBS domain-containing protein
MQVRDVLKAKPRRLLTINPDATVAEAIHRLVEHNIGSLPILEGDRLVGIFTERDVLRGVDEDCEAFGNSRVGDVMTRDPIGCSPDDDVEQAMALMSDHAIGQLPVVEPDGTVVGVVSVGDIIKLLHDHVATENRHLLEYLYGPA